MMHTTLMTTNGTVNGVAVEKAIQYLSLAEVLALVIAEENAVLGLATVACSDVETLESTPEFETVRVEAA